jgi:hypothetical protein
VVLGEGCDIVTGETCISEHKQLRRGSCSTFSSSVDGAVPISAYR